MIAAKRARMMTRTFQKQMGIMRVTMRRVKTSRNLRNREIMDKMKWL